MTDPSPAPAYRTPTAFDRKLAGIGKGYDTEVEKQSALMFLLVREVHTVKLILWWVLIIVPILVVVFGGLLVAAAHQAPTVTSPTGF